MTTARRRSIGRRDVHEPEIIEAFVIAGATVTQLSAPNVPDLLVGFLGATHLVEVKTDNAVLEAGQAIWHDRWKGERPVIVRNAPQARKWVTIWTREWLIAQKGLGVPVEPRDLLDDLAQGVGREPSLETNLKRFSEERS